MLSLPLVITLLDLDDPLQQKMFRDRATVFKDRMGWDVNVTSEGFEMDQYDIPGLTQYLIFHDDKGNHLASTRVTPVKEACMAIAAFDGLCSLDMITEPESCMEITRFCVMDEDRDASRSREVMLATAKHICSSPRFKSGLAVFDKVMIRVYRRIGFEPTVLNQIGRLCVGQWTEEQYEEILALDRQNKGLE